MSCLGSDVRRRGQNVMLVDSGHCLVSAGAYGSNGMSLDSGQYLWSVLGFGSSLNLQLAEVR